MERLQGLITCLALLMIVPVTSCGSRQDDLASEQAVPSDSSGIDSLPSTLGFEKLGFIRGAQIFLSTGEPGEGTSLRDDADALYLIRSIRERIESGDATFPEMAQEYSQCPSSGDGGRLPDFTSGAIARPLDSTLSSLAPGQLSEIVHTRFGYHLLIRLQ